MPEIKNGSKKIRGEKPHRVPPLDIKLQLMTAIKEQIGRRKTPKCHPSSVAKAEQAPL